MEFTRKRLTLVPQERNSLRTIDARQNYCRYVNTIPEENLVFLDETGFNFHTKRHYGYSLKNTKCFLTAPANRGRNISLMAAINKHGVITHEIQEGAYNGNLFIQFIHDKLKTHFERHPNDILIMDNCAFHHRGDVIALLISLRISYQFLPAYSPQLNPIEEYFSHLKARYCSLRPAPITQVELKTRISEIISINTIEFDGWYRHMKTWIEKGIDRHNF
jgi:transposase